MTNTIRKIGRFFHLLFSGSPKEKIYLRDRLRRVPIFGNAVTWILKVKAWLCHKTPDDYAKMQKELYETAASFGEVAPGVINHEGVVGSLEQHDQWTDYEEYLMRYVPKDASWVAIDYGCGPGRNIRRWTDRFRRIDGVDISQQNLDNARVFIKDRVSPNKWPNLYVTTGMNCGDAPLNCYDFAFSTICIQHICVYSIRFSIFKSLFECLKPGGRLSVQMGFGVPSPNTVPYYKEHVQAIDTNRGCDVAVGSPDEISKDLEKIGFISFEHWIRPVGPGDVHPRWIFFTAVKPPTTKHS